MHGSTSQLLVIFATSDSMWLLKCLFQLCGILTYRIFPSQFPRSALVVSVVLKFHCDCSGSTTTCLRGCTLCHMACFHLVPPHVMCWSLIHIILRINVCVRSVLCTTWSHFSSHKSGLNTMPKLTHCVALPHLV